MVFLPAFPGPAAAVPCLFATCCKLYLNMHVSVRWKKSKFLGAGQKALTQGLLEVMTLPSLH